MMFVLVTLRRLLIVGVGLFMLFASWRSFETSGQAWYDWVSFGPSLVVIMGLWLGFDTLERYLTGLDQSLVRLFKRKK